jgi:hypothetical protein
LHALPLANLVAEVIMGLLELGHTLFQGHIERA